MMLKNIHLYILILFISFFSCDLDIEYVEVEDPEKIKLDSINQISKDAVLIEFCITLFDLISCTLNFADKIIPEPLGGAHNNWGNTAETIKSTLLEEIRNLHKLNSDQIKNNRYEKFRSFGKFKDTTKTKSK